jgi:hypothetical protein
VRVLKELKGQLDHRVILEHRALKGHRVLLDRVLKGLRV